MSDEVVDSARRRISRSTLAVVVGLSGCNSTGVGPQSVAGMQTSAPSTCTKCKPAYLGSGSTGNGTLFFNGQSYPFSVAGVGMGGMGLSTVDAQGEVYGLKAPRRISSALMPEARYGFALGTTSSGDSGWKASGASFSI